MAAAGSNSEPRINDRIRAREVRLVAANGEQVGIKPLPEALAMAREQGLDLVEVADKANPPVCRIMDYGKYRYETAQRAKQSKKKSTNVQVKEMKYRPKIGQGDFDTKTRKVEKFLGEGNKVKITIMFRGREVYHPELGRKILDDIAVTIGHVGRVEVYPRLDGRNMTMVLSPDKQAQAAHARRLAEEARTERSERGTTDSDTDTDSASNADSDEMPVDEIILESDETTAAPVGTEVDTENDDEAATET